MTCPESSPEAGLSPLGGYFFIPGVDLGLVYAPMQLALMKAKLPVAMHRDVILFNARPRKKRPCGALLQRRWTAHDLFTAGAIDAAEPCHMVLRPGFEDLRDVSERKKLRNSSKGVEERPKSIEHHQKTSKNIKKTSKNTSEILGLNGQNAGNRRRSELRRLGVEAQGPAVGSEPAEQGPRPGTEGPGSPEARALSRGAAFRMRFACVSLCLRALFLWIFGLQRRSFAAMFLGLLQVLDSMDGEMSFPGRVAGVDRAAPKL